jgi:hypothetical protein
MCNIYTYVGTCHSNPGANPTIASCLQRLVRFENGNVFFYFETHSSLLQPWRCGCKFKSRTTGSSQEVEQQNNEIHFVEIKMFHYLLIALPQPYQTGPNTTLL